MSKTELDLDSIEATNGVNTVGLAKVESFNGQPFTLEYIQEAIDEIREENFSDEVWIDFAGDSDDGARLLAIKPKDATRAMVVAPRIVDDYGECNKDVDEAVPSGILKNKKGDVNKRLIQAEQMKRGNNTPNGMDQYLAGYIDAHYQFKDEVDSMKAMLEVYDQ